MEGRTWRNSIPFEVRAESKFCHDPTLRSRHSLVPSCRLRVLWRLHCLGQTPNGSSSLVLVCADAAKYLGTDKTGRHSHGKMIDAICGRKISNSLRCFTRSRALRLFFYTRKLIPQHPPRTVPPTSTKNFSTNIHQELFHQHRPRTIPSTSTKNYS